MTDSILVIDLEATCSDDETIATESMETIEIGACWIDTNGFVLDRFQSFVRPVVNPQLTEFCSILTGIQQRDVDSAPLFPAAAELLRQFTKRHEMPSSFWTSWGAYNRRQIERDSGRHRISEPIDLSHRDAKAQRIGKEVGMAKACELAGLALKGAHHRALDDALNVARLQAS